MSDSDQLLKIVDSPADQAEVSEIAPSPPGDPRYGIVQNLGKALHAAADKIQRNLAGESVFENDGERKTAMDLVKLLPHLLPLMHRFRPPRDPNMIYIPPCPMCGAPPGKHWAQQCPRTHPNSKGKSIFDYAEYRLITIDENTEILELPELRPKSYRVG